MSRIWTLTACCALLLAAGCVPTSQYVEMRSKYEEEAAKGRRLVDENEQLKNQLDRLRAQLAELGIDYDKAQKIIDLYKGGGHAFPKSPHWELLPSGGIRLGELTFRSGSAKLSGKGVAALDAFAVELAKKGSVLVVVDGHTDSDPIRRSGHASNWELSGKRAAAVVNYLVEVKKVARGRRTVLRGFGPYRPVDPKVKARNRRVEIFAIPLGKVGSAAAPAGDPASLK